MITAVDTSVLIAITKGEESAEGWAETLARSRSEGEAVVCDVVAAEFFALLLDEPKFQRVLDGLGIGTARSPSKPRVLRGGCSTPTAEQVARGSTWCRTS